MLITRVSTQDTELAMEATQDFFPGFTATAGDEPARFELFAHHVAGLTYLDYSTTGLHARLATTYEGYGVCELELEGRMTTGRDTIDVKLPFAIPPVMIADLTRVHSHVMQIDPDELTRFVRYDLGGDRFSLRTLQAAPISAEAAAYWRTAASFVREQMVSGVADNPVIGASLRQLVMAAYLRVFPTTWSEARTPRDGSRAVPAALRRAVAYMEHHAAEPITLSDVAEAARMSPRGLQEAFRRTFDSTPTAYLRRLRLEGARRDLLAADPSRGDTVARIAQRWGFVQMGRFAVRYGEAFGESPSESLRR